MDCWFPHVYTKKKENALKKQIQNKKTMTIIKERNDKRSVIDPYLTLQ